MGTRIVSAMSRVVEAPDLWESRLSAEFAGLCPRVVEGDGGLEWMVGDVRTDAGFEAGAVPDRATMARLSTHDGRLSLQARDAAAGEVLYSVGGVWNAIQATQDEPFIIACTRAYNDWLAELCAATPERLIGVAKLPTTGVADATAELERVHGLGLKGAMLDAWPGGADCPPSMEECDPFWAKAAALGMPISLHRPLGGEEEPAYSVSAGIAPEYYGDMIAIVYANIPDRFPGLRFVSTAPNAGWAPSQFEALNESYMRTAALRKFSLGDPDLLPSDYLRRFFFFLVQEDRVALANRDYFGEAHLMWGGFAFEPYVSEWPGSRALFDQMTAGLPGVFTVRFAGGNVERLYGIGGATPFSDAEIRRYDSYALI